TAYISFKKHNLYSFWLNRTLEKERFDTKTNFDIATTKTARIVQNASLQETSRAAGLVESSSNLSIELHVGSELERFKSGNLGTYQDADHEVNAQPGSSSAGKLKRSIRKGGNIEEGEESDNGDGLEQQGELSNEKQKKKCRVEDRKAHLRAKSQPIGTLASASDTPTNQKHDQGRHSSLPTGRDAFVSKPYVDATSFKVYNDEIGDWNIGQLFNKFQVDSTSIVNNFNITATLSNISQFLAMNYIFTIFEELPGLPPDVLQSIRQTYSWPPARLGDDALHLCADLDQQLAMGEQIRAVASSPELSKIVILYQMIELKLPVQHNLFSNGLEDTYCHQVIDALVASHFPTRSAKYSVDWANGEAHGSKHRRGHGYRPDACIKKYGRQVAFLEIKPPGDSHTIKEYLWDYWNLANCAKDAIDLFLREGIPVTKAAAVQLFRKPRN
ncbi:hypothetical protein BGX34_003863, partial [Mortierella sp. NVP85]